MTATGNTWLSGIDSRVARRVGRAAIGVAGSRIWFGGGAGIGQLARGYQGQNIRAVVVEHDVHTLVVHLVAGVSEGRLVVHGLHNLQGAVLALYVGQGVEVVLHRRGFVGDVVDHVGAGVGGVEAVGDAVLEAAAGQDRVGEAVVAIEIEIDSEKARVIDKFVPDQHHLGAGFGDIDFVSRALAVGDAAGTRLLRVAVTGLMRGEPQMRVGTL